MPRVTRALTDRQRAVLDFIQHSLEQQGYPPTIREIARHLNVNSPNGVTDHLKALERKGYLKRQGYKSRGLRIVLQATEGGQKRNEAAAPSPAVTTVPMLGRVAAGEPIPAIESAEEYLHVDSHLVGRNENVFALRIRGESMVEAGILDGDTVLVSPQLQARTGEIVVVRLDGDATCKYFHPDPLHDRVVLRPANRHMVDIIVTAEQYRDSVLVGRVIALLRKF